MVVLMRVTISALLVLSGALKTTATPQAASSDSADFSSSQLESIDPSSAFSSSQPFTSAGDGVDHASAITLSAQSSDPTGIDDISAASPIALSSDQAVLSAGDGIDRASAITLTQTTPTPSDGIDHAPATTFHPTSTSPPDGIDHAPVVTLTSTTSQRQTTRTATSTLFVTPPPVYTTMTVPPLFVNTTEATLSATTATAEPSSTTAEDSTGSTRRFCPWCYPEISLSEVGEECNLVLQLHLRHPGAETTRERVPWAILNSDFTVLLDGGLVKRDTPVVVSLGGKGRVQMSGNRVWVGNGG